jgi:quercetin dioxygenase-like cupin family protein
MRASGATELGYVVSGRLRIETASARFEVQAGDVLTSSPTEPHSTTALEDSEIFFVLLDPV